MKGGTNESNQYNNGSILVGSTINDNNDGQGNDDEIQILVAIGFEDDELEMYLNSTTGLNPGDFINKYLEISRNSPFNQQWQSYNDILQSGYELNIDYNGRSLTKRDIAEAVLRYFDEEMTPRQGGKRKKSRRTRYRRKKSRRTYNRRKKTRRTTRYRRRH